MNSFPFGYFIHIVIFALATYFVIIPREWRWRFNGLGLYLGVVNELPMLALLMSASAAGLAYIEGDVDTTIGKVLVGISILTMLGLILITYRSMKAAPAINQALDESLGVEWRTVLDDHMKDWIRKRFSFSALLGPFFIRRYDVERIANIRYGDAGKRNLLDVYRHRSQPTRCPVLIHLHGGAFRTGKKNRQSLPLIYRFASKGWVCVSTNYRLIQDARFPAQVIDVKKVIAWVRTYGHTYGADPDNIFIAGSSAGGHLASIAALTQNNPRFQPGFEQADTTVTAVISMYGYYGGVKTKKDLTTSPLGFNREHAPPFLVIHGEQDSLVPVEDAERFGDHLRKSSSNPVINVKLPGGEHNFDLFHSFRSEAVLNGIEAFTSWVLLSDLNKQG